MRTVARLRVGLALTFALLAPLSAQAGTETLKRSVSNLLFAPLDLVLSPVVAGKTVVNNLQNIEDTTAVRVAYTAPGFVWLTGLNAGASVLRALTGALELVPGIVLLALPESEMSPLFDPAIRGDALVDAETPVMPVRFGVDYATPPS